MRNHLLWAGKLVWVGKRPNQVRYLISISHLNSFHGPLLQDLWSEMQIQCWQWGEGTADSGAQWIPWIDSLNAVPEEAVAWPLVYRRAEIRVAEAGLPLSCAITGLAVKQLALSGMQVKQMLFALLCMQASLTGSLLLGTFVPRDDVA